MPILYKYLPPERDTYLDDELLRFTQPGALNDPFECIPIISPVDEKLFLDNKVELGWGRFVVTAVIEGKQLGDWREGKEFLREGLRKEYLSDPLYLPRVFERFYLERANKTVGILSLSRRWNSTLMWSHYSASHAGYCVGFDSNHPFFNPERQHFTDMGGVEPVLYDPKRLAIQIDRDFQKTPPLFYRKSVDWSYEEEERIVRFLNEADKTISKTPFDVHLFKVPRGAIVEIIYGITASDTLKGKIIAASKILGVPAWEAVISRSSFDVERRLAS